MPKPIPSANVTTLTTASSSLEPQSATKNDPKSAKPLKPKIKLVQQSSEQIRTASSSSSFSRLPSLATTRSLTSYAAKLQRKGPAITPAKMAWGNITDLTTRTESLSPPQAVQLPLAWRNRSSGATAATTATTAATAMHPDARPKTARSDKTTVPVSPQEVRKRTSTTDSLTSWLTKLGDMARDETKTNKQKIERLEDISFGIKNVTIISKKKLNDTEIKTMLSAIKLQLVNINESSFSQLINITISFQRSGFFDVSSQLETVELRTDIFKMLLNECLNKMKSMDVNEISLLKAVQLLKGMSHALHAEMPLTPELECCVMKVVEVLLNNITQITAEQKVDSISSLLIFLKHGIADNTKVAETVERLLTKIRISRLSCDRKQRLLLALFNANKFTEFTPSQTCEIKRCVCELIRTFSTSSIGLNAYSAIQAISGLGTAIDIDFEVTQKIIENSKNLDVDHGYAKYQILWALLAIAAKYKLDMSISEEMKKHHLEYLNVEILSLYKSLSKIATKEIKKISVLSLASYWLEQKHSYSIGLDILTSPTQSHIATHLRENIKGIKIKEEQCHGTLPPMDIMLPDYKIAVDVQGPYHFPYGDNMGKNGATLLKRVLYEQYGYDYIEVDLLVIDGMEEIKKDALQKVKYHILKKQPKLTC